jgi:hypothetical protein
VQDSVSLGWACVGSWRSGSGMDGWAAAAYLVGLIAGHGAGGGLDGAEGGVDV